MKKAKKLIFLSLVLIILLLVYFNVKNKTPKDIYNENIDSIITLKGVTLNNLIIFCSNYLRLLPNLF